MLSLGSIMGKIPNDYWQGKAYFIHKSTGILTLLFAVLFILWSSFNKKPAYPAEMKQWEGSLATIVRMMLYVLLVAMPLSGWILSTAAGKFPNFYGLGQIPLPGIPTSKVIAHTAVDMHLVLAWTLFGFVVLHAIGALKHHIIDKNDVMKRMFRCRHR